MRQLALLICGLLTCVLGISACDDDSGGKMSMDLSMPADLASSCGHVGDKALNATGVGQYCASQDDCAAPMGSTGWKATLCSTIGDATSHFCTFTCTVATASVCGTGATCVCANIGCGCTPNVCNPGDGGA
jgi:hypothetical protein